MTDNRFDKVFTDPRFMVAPKKVSKVKIDKRFEGMFKKKEFNVVSKVDKYGRKIAKSDNYALQNYYKDDSDAKSESGSGDSENPEQDNKTKKLAKVESGRSSSEEAGKKFYDDDGKFHWSGQSSSDAEDSDAQKDKKKNKDKSKQKKHAKKERGSQDSNQESESSDFNEDVDSASYSDAISGVWSLESEKQDEAAVDTEKAVGKRIAVKQLDWDSINATDLFALFQSFCKGSMSIKKVEVHPSKFGKENMERDILYGPPKEMFERKVGRKPSRKAVRKEAKNEFLSDDDFELDENDGGENMAQLRKYEVRKMDYFYAVVYCNNKKTASKIIEENQDLEFELTNIRLNLYIVPDDLELPYTPKQSASDLPTNYEFNAGKISRALNHSTVKLSWDQTDPNRAAKLQQNYKELLKKDGGGKFDSDDDAYDGLIAGSDSDDSAEMSEGQDAEGNARKNQAKIDEMRRRLLGGISEDKPRRKNQEGEDGEQLESDDEISDGQKEELQVNFGIGFGEDIG